MKKDSQEWYAASKTSILKTVICRKTGIGNRAQKQQGVKINDMTGLKTQGCRVSYFERRYSAPPFPRTRCPGQQRHSQFLQQVEILEPLKSCFACGELTDHRRKHEPDKQRLENKKQN